MASKELRSSELGGRHWGISFSGVIKSGLHFKCSFPGWKMDYRRLRVNTRGSV
jgi:hypothetical protein